MPTTFKIEGTTLENSVAAENLVVVYKANREDQVTIGQELGRAVANPDGSFEITFDDWFWEVFVVGIDPTDSVKYNGKILDWVTPDLADYDPYYDSIECLYRMDGADTANAFLDDTGNTTAVAFGGVTTSVDQVKFGSAAAKFVKANPDSRVEIYHAGELNLGNEDFCIEFFVYFNALSGVQVMLTNRSTSDSTDYTYYIYTDGSTLKAYFTTDIDGHLHNASAGTITVDQWHHIAYVRDGNIVRIFLDGTQTATISVTNYSAAADNLEAVKVGYDPDSVTKNVDGFMDSLRWTVGESRYQSNFTPPATDYPVDRDRYFYNVQCLLHMEGLDQGTNFSDTIGNVVTPVGNVVTASAQAKYGTTSAHMVDTNSRLSVAYQSGFDLGAKDFTMEAWVYLTTNDGDYKLICSKRTSTAVRGAFIFRIDPNESVQFYLDDDGVWATLSTPSSSVPISQWTHIAVTRKGSIFKIFINGIELAYLTSSAVGTPDSNPLLLGSEGDNNHNLPGYIDEFRLTVGSSRYNENFIPLNRQFQDL